MPSDIAKKIKKIRDSYNLSQERFANRLGLSGKSISAYETGRTSPPLRVLERITQTYQTPIMTASKDIKIDLMQKLTNIEREVAGLKDILEEEQEAS